MFNDRLFVVNKPIFCSSNYYLRQIKRKYGIKKAGFSGTLDPFAYGCLIVAFGKYTKLFQYLDNTPKRYKATIWLGTVSSSFDIENIEHINKNPKKLDTSHIKKELQKLLGDISYTAPKYSAKRIDGKRAYLKARAGELFEPPKINSIIYETNFLSYNHPFISFDITVSEGTYIRSIAQILLKKIQTKGTLSSLERVNEGKFYFDREKAINPLKNLKIKTIKYNGEKLWIQQGKKIDIKYLCDFSQGLGKIVFDDFFTIVDIKKDKVEYILNDIKLHQ
ncbi:MAG: tRNA pseudouridine(55) synthase TruB [Epsilonproteobacteria bacterium]|nr:MAG: tRNA pseudouridine(55) synthase TruB [Campylobacterota bacterium]